MNPLLTKHENLIAAALAYWYFGYHSTAAIFDDVDLDTADSLMHTLNGRNLKGARW
jgi:hypothetical protein